MIKSALTLAFVLLSSLAFAAPPKATVTGPTTGTPGDLIALDGATSTGKFKTWRVWIELDGKAVDSAQYERVAEKLRAVGYTVTAPAKDDANKSLVVDGGDKLVLPSYPGTYRAALAVGNEEGVDLTLWTVVITGNTAPPPPDDDPAPPDDPPPDEPPPPVGVQNRYDLEASCRIWLTQLSEIGLAQKPAMRTIFKTIGEGAADGKYASAKDVQAALKATLDDADKNGHVKKSSWDPWGKAANAAILALQSSGKIVTAQDYGQAMREIAEGLK